MLFRSSLLRRSKMTTEDQALGLPEGTGLRPEAIQPTGPIAGTGGRTSLLAAGAAATTAPLPIEATRGAAGGRQRSTGGHTGDLLRTSGGRAPDSSLPPEAEAAAPELGPGPGGRLLPEEVGPHQPPTPASLNRTRGRPAVASQRLVTRYLRFHGEGKRFMQGLMIFKST